MSANEYVTPRAVLDSVAERSSGHQDADAAEIVVGSGGWLVAAHGKEEAK